MKLNSRRLRDIRRCWLEGACARCNHETARYPADYSAFAIEDKPVFQSRPERHTQRSRDRMMHRLSMRTEDINHRTAKSRFCCMRNHFLSHIDASTSQPSARSAEVNAPVPQPISSARLPCGDGWAIFRYRNIGHTIASGRQKTSYRVWRCD